MNPIQIVFRCLVAAFLLGLVLCVRAAVAQSREDGGFARQIAGLRFAYLPLQTAREPASEAEDRELWEALSAGKGGGFGATVAGLERFLASHANSRWSPAIRANLGRYYREHGRYSAALQHWELAWQATRLETTGVGKQVADFTFAYWTRLLASLGRKEHLKGLLMETQGRIFDSGPLQQMVNTTKEAYHVMRSDPGISFRCGTYALRSVAKTLKGSAFDTGVFDLEPSPPTGFTMTRLVELAGGAGLDLVPVKWDEKRELVVPCVIHWKENHYAAVLEEKDGHYHVLDPTFGNGLWISKKDLEHEASGYFLIPRTQYKAGWQSLSVVATDQIRGMGFFYHANDPHDGCGNNSGGGNSFAPERIGSGDPEPGPYVLNTMGGDPASVPVGGGGGGRPCGGICGAGGGGGGGSGGSGRSCPTCPRGLAEWEVSEPYINLWIYDEPLGYEPGLGDRISFKLAYKQRDSRPIYDEVFNLGPLWNCSWISEIAFNELELRYGGWEDPPVKYVITGGESTYIDNGSAREFFSQSTMSAVGGQRSAGFDVFYKDGSKDSYHLVVTNFYGRHHAFLTSRVNPSGHATRMDYEINGGNILLRYVVDADGRTNTLTYTNTAFPTQITGVEDPFGRKTFIQYDHFGVLTNILDVAGLSSSFKYDSQGWITNMTTPYGTTVFYHSVNADICDTNSPANCSTNEFGDKDFDINPFVAVRTLKVVDPVGATNLYMLRQNCEYLYTNAADYYDPNSHDSKRTPFIAPTWLWSYENGVVPGDWPGCCAIDNGLMQMRNSFHWGPRQATGLPANLDLLMPADYRKARLRHWLHEAHATGASLTLSQTLGMQREPSPDGVMDGQTTWLAYDGGGGTFEGAGPFPSFVLRTIPDGSIWYHWFIRDEWGRATNIVDTFSTWVGQSPTTRTNIYVYSGTDLVQHLGPLGHLEAGYAYNGNHQVIRFTNAVGDVTYYTYDGDGRHTSTITPAGLTTTNLYFDSGQGKNFAERTIDLEINRTNSFIYQDNLVLTHTDERGLRTTNVWDALQRLRRVSYPDGTFITNLYDKLDLVLTADRMGFTNAYGYDAVRRLVAHTNTLGYYTLYNYCSCGALDSIRDAGGGYTYFFYDNAGRLANRVDPDGYAVTNGYTLLGQAASFSDNAGRSFTNWYNNQGLWVGRTSEFGTEQSVLHDIEDRAQFVTDENGVTVTNIYDDLGRLRSRGYPDGGVEHFGYSARGLVAYTNQLGFTNFYAYDEAGRKRFETNANWELIRYTNNAAGDLLALVDGKGQVTKWKYDEYGRVTNKFDQSSALRLVYTYDANSRLRSRYSTAKGTTFYTNDPLGNLTFINYPGFFDVSFAYDALSRVTNMVDGLGTTKYSYTAAGRLLTEDGPLASDTVTNAYFNGLRTNLSLAQPHGYWTNGFAYDSAKRLASVTSPAGAFTYSLGGTAATSPLIQKLALPNTSYITNAYDAVARLRFTKLNNSSHSTLDSAAYGYNAGHQRINFTNAAGTCVSNRYDGLGQLRVADSSVNAEDRGYTYDKAWNLNYRTNNGTLETFTVNVRNELTAGPDSEYYEYDHNGNLEYRQPGGNDYEYWYDAENRLVEINFAYGFTLQLAYDGLGRLREKSTWVWDEGEEDFLYLGAVNYVYDGWRVIQERDADTGLPTVSYTRGTDLSGSMEGAGGIGGLLARTAHSGTYGTNLTHAFYHADGNGNVTALVDGSEALVASYRYDPYGNTLSKSGSLADANVYRFSSKEVEPQSGLYYYGHRFYSPAMQRWLNRDPIGENGGVNLYGVFENDPVGSVDALGLDVAGPGREPTPDPSFDPDKWKNENCLAYALNRPCNKDMYPGVGQGSHDNCDDLKKAMKDNYGAVDPTLGRCPPGWHKIRIYPGFHVQRQDGDGKWSEKNKGHKPRRCSTDSSGEPIDSPQDKWQKPQKPCKGDLCVPN